MSTSKKETPKPVEKKPTAEKKPVAKAPVPMKKIVPPSEPKDGTFQAKKLGANLIATVKGTQERYARKVSKEEGEAIMKKMELHNKRPSAKLKDEIIGLMQPVTVAAKVEEEKTEAKTKGLKQQIKKETKKSKVSVDKDHKSLVQQLEDEIKNDETAIPKLQAILDKYKKVEDKKPEAQQTSSPRSGENYRRY